MAYLFCSPSLWAERGQVRTEHAPRVWSVLNLVMNGSLSSTVYSFKAGRQIARGMDRKGTYFYKTTASMKLNSLQKEYMYKLYAMYMTFALSYLNFSVYTRSYKTSDIFYGCIFVFFLNIVSTCLCIKAYVEHTDQWKETRVNQMHRDKVTICLGKEKYIRRRLPLRNAPAVKSLRLVMKFSVTITATWHFSVTSCIKTWASDQRWQHDAARGGWSSKTEKKKKNPKLLSFI